MGGHDGGTAQPYRLATGGRIDRGRTLRFTFDGRTLTGHPGDTVASALLANGVRVVGRSVDLGRPRGVYTCGVEEPNALLRIDAEPMVAATTVPLRDGLAAASLRGKGRLTEPDGAAGRHDKAYLHCDVLVVGGGPAGLAAALAAGVTGARVVLVDEQEEVGGDLLGSRVRIDGAPAAEWVAAVLGRLAALPETRVLPRTTALGYYDHNYLVALERRGPDATRLWHIRAVRVVLATGAHERLIPFPGNDRPGVMLANAARTYANRYGVLPGRRAVVFTCADSGYLAAADLLAAGVDVAAIVDPRPGDGPAAAAVAGRGVEVLRGAAVTGTGAGDQGVLASVTVRAGGHERVFEADLLAVCGGWNPAVHLFGQSQGRLRFDDDLQAYVPHLSAQAERSAGACRGVYGTAAAIADGFAAGAQAAELCGYARPGRWAAPPTDEPDGPAEPTAPLRDLVEHEPAPGAHREAFVDLHRDVTVAGIRRALGAGLRSAEHVKRYTTAGTGAEQGKTAVTSPVVSALLGDPAGPTTFRPPYTPVSFAALAGKDRGMLSDPARLTALHDRHVALGAAFEDAGGWLRPRCYPRPGEDTAAAVLRECTAVRTACGALDASTLGKIDVQGPDAGEFLDRVYTNTMSTLPVGSCRYGLMCRADGTVFDDGVVARLAEDHFLVTTTTGNAAAVLDRLEEWRQTEWPGLRVWLTPVTDHWSVITVAGPRSRRVVAALAPGLDLAGFPFMTWREATVLGVAGARILRVSFSGELCYEIHVPSWYGAAVWDAVLELGAVPYGTEAMHVLRAEKGHILIGHETDGTVIPHDLGLARLVATGKRDFIGKRSFARPDARRPDRRRLVGLLPEDPAVLVDEGAQLIAPDGDGPPRPPVRMLGHVTSSYRSAALGRTFALALATAAPGDRLVAWSRGRAVPVTVVDPVFYDPGGARRDGDPADRDRAPEPPPRPLAPAAARSPLAGYAERFAAAGPGTTIREIPFLRMWEVRARAVPSAPTADVLELGPGWWLIVGDEEPVVHHGCCVDVSAQRTVIELSGPEVREVLLTGCPIDLHPSAFEVGQHAQTLLGQAPVIVQRTADDTYRLYVRASYAAYLADWLLDACRAEVAAAS
ncbi:MAG: 2Fe-2S iron-sulfur cluster-binding protein [Actinomycetes bacterium]